MADSGKSIDENIVKPSSLQPPILMKIDEPAAENDQKESEENEKNLCTTETEGIKMCSPSFRSSILTTNNPFSSPRVARGILKPPQLSLNNTSNPNNKTFVLKPSQLNPFASKSDASDKNCEKIENGDKQLNQINGETPKFVPLIVPESTSTSGGVSKQPSTSSTKVSSSSFVFGENLHTRVAGDSIEDPKPSTSLNSNGTSEMLFSSAIKNEVKLDIPKEKEVKSLSESAREYEELRANKRKYEEVEVLTGEEDEKNIINMSCKLFAYDKATGSWQERGRGTLRLNDFENDGQVGSRLVFRTSGSLRVILNTKIWAEMTVDKASEKSVRLTALDAQGEIKVFLIMTNIEDSTRLFNQLQTRLTREIASQKRKKVSTTDVTDSGGN